MPGGVCAVLDYEVDMMADYVAEMATRVVTPDSAVTSPFRKFVSQILTSTRLPSTTILLGMNYLAKRINALKSQGPYKATEGQVWRYLTVSLLLGSKFLDDNTFQNRSWSEVSGIAVAELNALEFEWVNAMGWRLYVNLDLSKDYQAWLENWRDWQHMKKRRAAQANRERIASIVPAIDTDIGMYHNSNRHSPHSRYVHEQAAEYERHHAMKAHGYRSRESAWAHNPWNAPLTPPDSGYGTPEYAMSATSTTGAYGDWFNQGATPFNSGYSQPQGHNVFFPTRHGTYVNHYSYGQGAWEHGLAECSCPNCVGPMKQAPYFMQHGYGQPVVG
ncbi:hypothetical protein HJFPF1_01568 [Paramyrothecium foliicola]|nr:hypothetical protein HJFPF1_01568 [Paramyrothecium foliicola]